MKEINIQLKDYQVATRYAQELEAENKVLKKENKALKKSRDELLYVLTQTDRNEMVYVNRKYLSVGKVVLIHRALKESK